MDNTIPYFYIENNKIIYDTCQSIEYIFFKVEIDNIGLVSSSAYDSKIKNLYHSFPYNLKIERIVYKYNNNIIDQINDKDINNNILNSVISLLNNDNYYLCKYDDDDDNFFRRINKNDKNDKNDIKKIMFGFKKPSDSHIIKIYDLNPSKPYDEKINWNPKIKIINLLLEEKILKIL